MPGYSWVEITITPCVCSAWESQVHSSICCWEDKQWFYCSVIAHFCTDQLFAAVCHPFHDDPKHTHGAPPRCHRPECGCRSCPPEAGASSPGCSQLLCSSLAPRCSNKALRREPEISFLNIKPFCHLPGNVTSKEVDSSSSVTWLLVEALELLLTCY